MKVYVVYYQVPHDTDAPEKVFLEKEDAEAFIKTKKYPSDWRFEEFEVE